VQALEAIAGEAVAPLADGVLIGAELDRDHHVLQPLGRQQHDPRPPRQPLRGPPPPGQVLELGTLTGRQLDRHRRPAHRSSSSGSDGQILRTYGSGH
jgi:hypothetical protein